MESRQEIDEIDENQYFYDKADRFAFVLIGFVGKYDLKKASEMVEEYCQRNRERLGLDNGEDYIALREKIDRLNSTHLPKRLLRSPFFMLNNGNEIPVIVGNYIL